MVIILLLAGIAVIRFCNIFFLRPSTANRILTGTTAMGSAVAHALFFVQYPTLFSGLLALINLYLIINDLRRVELRMNPEYLKHSTRRTWVWLASYSGLSVAGLYAWRFFEPSGSSLLLAYDLIVLVGAAVVAVTAGVNIRRTRLSMPTTNYADMELPTVTVAVPARNETDTLKNCLTTLIQNDYPKLEILVLDDCSQDETAQIIKSFSHDGVRFVEGTPPPDDHWLHKNWAYEQLLKNATGEVLVFVGVDVEVHPKSLRHLVTYMKASDKKMISLMPRRIRLTIESVFVQPMRYWWELILPHVRRPAVLSTAWAVDRVSLKDFGGFKSVSRAVTPERYIARSFGRSYGFYRTNPEVGIQTNKPFADQIRTAIRTRYPQVQKRPEYLLPLSLGILLLWLGPLVRLFVSADHGNLLPLLSLFVLVGVHVGITTLTNYKVWWLSICNFPVVVLLEVALLHISMYEYEFSEVQWKGVNICLPVMHIGKRLPELPDPPITPL